MPARVANVDVACCSVNRNPFASLKIGLASFHFAEVVQKSSTRIVDRDDSQDAICHKDVVLAVDGNAIGDGWRALRPLRIAYLDCSKSKTCTTPASGSATKTRWVESVATLYGATSLSLVACNSGRPATISRLQSNMRCSRLTSSALENSRTNLRCALLSLGSCGEDALEIAARGRPAVPIPMVTRTGSAAPGLHRTHFDREQHVFQSLISRNRPLVTS
jgi:hypothetical protein